MPKAGRENNAERRGIVMTRNATILEMTVPNASKRRYAAVVCGVGTKT
jgi:hypothetical protein